MAKQNDDKKILEEMRELQAEMNRNFSAYSDSLKKAIELMGGVAEHAKKVDDTTTKVNNTTKKTNTELSKTSKVLKEIAKETGNLFGGISGVWKYLQESDKTAKRLALSMGLNAKMSQMMTTNLRESSAYAARMGVSMEELAKAQLSFSDTTNTMSLLTKKNYEDIAVLSASTGLATEEFGKLSGQIQNMGGSVNMAYKIIDKTFKASQNMGLNNQKVVKQIFENFDKMNRFRFQGGVDSFARMVQYALQTKTSLEGTFSAIDKFRSLEGTIEATARLYSMGGEFAKADAFQLGFLSRNDPEKFQQQMTTMLKGLATYNKKNNIFEVSAVDIDRLREVAEITGQDYNKLVESAKQLGKQDMFNKTFSGISKEDKVFLSNIAQINEKGQFVISMNGKDVEVQKLIADGQIGALRQHTESLQKQAKAAQTFNDQFENTVNALKTNFLPILNVINKYLGFIDNIADSIGKKFGEQEGKGGLASDLTKLAGLGGMFLAYKGLGGIGGMIGNLFKGSGKTAEALDKFKDIPSQSTLLGKAAGIAAIGVAAAGVGAGIWMASNGISNLAKAFENQNAWKSIGIISSSLLGFGGAIAIAGIAAGKTAPALLAVGATALGIGAGIWLASTGMANFATAMGNTIKNVSGITNLGTSIASLGAGMLMLSSPTNLLGLGTLAGIGASLSANVNGFNSAGMAFKNMNDFLSKPDTNLTKLKETIESIKNFDSNSANGLNKALAKIEDVLSKPLKVEFDKKEVNITTKVDLLIDGERLASVLNVGKRNVQAVRKARDGR